MGGERKGPRARDRIIGARLRAIRKERTNLSLEEAAALAQWSLSTMSRIETGKRHVSTEDVATICTIYKLPVAERVELIELARAGNAAGWWNLALCAAPVDMSTLANYESEAVRLTDWSVNLVPGLLQTREYAVAMTRSSGIPAGIIEARWMARLRRQQILGTVDYTAFIGEAALRTPFGGVAALKRQLQHLAGARDRGVGLRVVPEHQPEALVAHSWLLMEFAHSSPVVNVEAIYGSTYLHDEVAEAYLPLRDRLDKLALSAVASQEMVRRSLRQLADG